jgi:DNA-binding CsgD family transcriptional regulator
VHSSCGLCGSICAVRERGGPDFNPREVALLRRIAPHLGAGLKAAVLRSQASLEANGDGVPGVLILDHQGEVLHYTQAAERWLQDLGDLGPGWWLTLHAAMSESQHLNSPGEIVIVIEPAGSKEMAWLNTATYGLSPREEEVVEFVVRGSSTRQISQALYVTEDTVQKHLQNVFEKVGVRSRRELVKRLYLNTIFP